MMNIIFRLLFLILPVLFCGFHHVKATIQRPEILVVNGDTTHIMEYPLEQKQYLDSNFMSSLYEPRVEYIGNGLARTVSTYRISSNCWRGYQGKWKIIHDSLFLVDLRPCLEWFGEENPLEIAKLFDSDNRDKGVYANWVFQIIRTDSGSFKNDKFRHAYVVIFGKVIKHFKVRKNCIVFSFQDVIRCYMPWKSSAT